MTNPPHLTEDPSAQDECPPLVAAQHQELPMPTQEPATRTTVSYAVIRALADRLDMPATNADVVVKKLLDAWDEQSKYIGELEEQLDGDDA